MKRLLAIQTELKCNKSQFNSFGKYNYRSCEDILESLKPLLKKNKVCLTLSDELVLHENGDAYICAIATLFDSETNEQIAQTKAYAMVDKTHKGMSADQQFGCASSYSRKYCLGAMFLLDDQKDADTDEHHIEAEGKAAPKKISDKQLKLLADLCAKTNKLDDVQKHYKVKNLAELTMDQGKEAITTLMNYAGKEK